MDLKGRNFLTLKDFTPEEITYLIDLSAELKAKKKAGKLHEYYKGKNIALIFEKTSTRTRCAFEVAAHDMGISYLTLYAFSTENWSRPKSEVDALMKLLRNYMKTCLKTAEKNRMRVRVIGDKTGLDEDIRTRIKELEEASKNNDGLNFQIAINYGSRDEMIRAMRKMTKDCADGRFAPEEITEELFEGYLDTHGIPDPDLLIRTSGELRLSNYLLWQLAYTEFYFTDVPWPDFSKEELEKAIEQYNSRDRRYGGIKEDEENV